MYVWMYKYVGMYKYKTSCYYITTLVTHRGRSTSFDLKVTYSIQIRKISKITCNKKQVDFLNYAKINWIFITQISIPTRSGEQFSIEVSIFIWFHYYFFFKKQLMKFLTIQWESIFGEEFQPIFILP